MRARLVLVALLAAMGAAAAGSADSPGEGECAALSVPGRAIEHPFVLPGGERAVLRDPYGGLVFRNRLFVSFVVKTVDKARRDQLVDHVEWRLDGDATALARNRGGRYALLLPSTGFPAGQHQLTAHVVLHDGQALDKTIDVNATDCQPVTLNADIAVNRGRRAPVTLSVGSGGPPMRTVAFTALRGLRATAPAALRGRAAGTLSFFDGVSNPGAPRGPASTLRLPRRASGRIVVLLRRRALRVTLHPGRRRLLDVSGLPEGTTGVRVRLASGVVAPRRSCPVRADLVATVLGGRGSGAAAVRASVRC
ncbi:MAG TPA: hypothetical protein VGJ32_16390 [Solirubrobacteraceae bacterium]